MKGRNQADQTWMICPLPIGRSNPRHLFHRGLEHPLLPFEIIPYLVEEGPKDLIRSSWLCPIIRT
jgi:hypothetical protein